MVGALAGRGEFATSYTPYQPEMSQGMLQAIYEYQTLICALTGMDLANASMYDAATGLAEAALMATALTDRPEVVVLKSVHPHYRQVIATYLDATGYRLREIAYTGTESDLDDLRQRVGEQTACVHLCSSPTSSARWKRSGARRGNSASRRGAGDCLGGSRFPWACSKPPGEYDVDIVVGEGQSLGNPMGFGGPLLGFFACKKEVYPQFSGPHRRAQRRTKRADAAIQ